VHAIEFRGNTRKQNINSDKGETKGNSVVLMILKWNMK
jgi:hypothetical protein